MGKITIKQLRQIAKERGMRRYSKLRKTVLIDAINAHRKLPQFKFYTVKQLQQKAKKRGVKRYSKLRKVDLIDALNAHILKLYESESAIKGFTKQYTIDGRRGIDVLIFLNVVRPQIIALLERNRRIKVNLVLTCTMERIDMKSGDVITASVPFVSKTVVNLDATDVGELYDNAVDKIQESMARFQMKEAIGGLKLSKS